MRDAFYSKNGTGFTRFDLKFGNVIDGIKIFDDSNTPSTTMYYGGAAGDYYESVRCPTGQRLYGLTGNYENSIN